MRVRLRLLLRGPVLIPLLITLFLAGFQVRPRAYWGTGWRPAPFREGLPTSKNGVVDRGFTFCRLLYQSVTSEQRGHGWNTDYPGSDFNFIIRFEELTTAQPSWWADGEPGYAVVRPSQEELYECPFLFGSDAGTVGFSTSEVAALRDYLLKGGLIWVDDFWGPRAWQRWSTEIGRVLPEFPIVDIPVIGDVLRYRAGETKILDFLMGQVMRRTQGKADPRSVRAILSRRLEE